MMCGSLSGAFGGMYREEQRRGLTHKLGVLDLTMPGTVVLNINLIIMCNVLTNLVDMTQVLGTSFPR